MTRKKLVTALSIICMIIGLWDIGIFLYESSVPSGPIVFINIAPLLSGVLALYIGFQLLQFHEIGRKIALFFLYVEVVISILIAFWSAYFLQTTKAKYVVGGLAYHDKQVYLFDNPYFVPGAWLVIAIIPLLVIVFLSQNKTRQLFAPQLPRSTTTEGISNSPQN